MSKRKLSPWCKSVRKAMIDRDWGVVDLAEACEYSKEYTSSVINGRVMAPDARRKISDILNIMNTDTPWPA